MLRKRGADTTQERKPSSSPSPKAKPATSMPRRSSRSIWVLLLWSLIAATTFIYIIIPAIFYYCPWIQQSTVFLNFVNIPPFPKLTSPESYGLKCTHNFYIDSDPGVKLGVWHVPPHSESEKCNENRDNWFPGNNPIILYLHGNGGSRAGGHRVALYKVLTRELRAHVVAPDYRGYADSSKTTPTALGIVDDAEAAYRWLRKSVPSGRIIIWGHSLGTGVSVYLVERLSALKSEGPAGLVLEAPFDAVFNVAPHHPLSIFHRYMPYFNAVFVDSIKSEATNFDSIAKVGNLSQSTPVLVLHARDDAMVPFKLGQKLYEALHASRKKGSAEVKLVAFDEKFGYGHKHICDDPGLPALVRQFFTKSFGKA
ncbi:lysophosphatidylserine lipase ABHD12-like [Ornithodoros turicata]